MECPGAVDKKCIKESPLIDIVLEVGDLDHDNIDYDDGKLKVKEDKRKVLNMSDENYEHYVENQKRGRFNLICCSLSQKAFICLLVAILVIITSIFAIVAAVLIKNHGGKHFN